MRLLWVSFLLVGGVACFPSQDGTSSWNTNPTWPYFSSSLSFEPDPSRSSYENPTEQSSGSTAFKVLPGHYGDTNVAVGGKGDQFWAQQQSPEDGQFGGSAVEYSLNTGPFWFVEENWSSLPNDDEPIFTDMSGRDPVFSLNAHSNYLLRRKVVTQAQFTPKGLHHPKVMVTSQSDEAQDKKGI